MNVLTENVAEVVRANFRRLPPAERREALRQLITDLDLPQPAGEWMGGEGEAKLEHAGASGSFLEWLEEQATQAEVETILRQYFPDFGIGALADPRQRLLINQRLYGLGPVALYELHQKFVRGAETATLLTPEEIVEKTRGTIRGIDRETLREIIEDENYCGHQPSRTETTHAYK